MTGTCVAKIDLTGLDGLTAELEPKANVIIGQIANDIAGDAKMRILSGPKTGIVYRHGKILHRASKRGEAPATDTGNLANSIEAEQKGRLLWWVRDGTEYGVYLELSRFLGRPFLVPAVEKFRAKFAEQWAELFKP